MSEHLSDNRCKCVFVGDEPFVCNACLDVANEYWDRINRARFRYGGKTMVIGHLNLSVLRRSIDDLLSALSIEGTDKEHNVKHLQRVIAEARAWLWEVNEVFDDCAPLHKAEK
jgi:hypothetical protein